MKLKNRSVLMSCCTLVEPAECDYQIFVCGKISNPENRKEKEDSYCKVSLCNGSRDCDYKEPLDTSVLARTALY